MDPDEMVEGSHRQQVNQLDLLTPALTAQILTISTRNDRDLHIPHAAGSLPVTLETPHHHHHQPRRQKACHSV